MAQKLNTVGKSIYNTGYQARMDSAVKQLLAQRAILAFILKYTVQEMSAMTPAEIEPLIDSVHVGTVPVEPGAGHAIITGEPQESCIYGESYITYDIRFIADLPGDETGKATKCSLIINLEAQSKPNQTYWLESRGILYCGRMLSEQMGRNVTDSHYENLEKVYSIWICGNCPQKDANTISEYGIVQRSNIGNYMRHPRIDLLSVVMIRLPKDDEWDKAKNPATELTAFLSTLLSSSIAPEEKIATLENDYGIQTTEEINQEVGSMCNWGEALAEQVAEKTTEKVTKETKRQAALDTAERMVKAGKYDDEEIADISGASLDDVQKLKIKLLDAVK